MPDRLACDEAMNLSKARLRVHDPDLKDGEVEKTVAGLVPVPWGLQGGFAVVYKFRTQSGKPRALRCFLAPMKADIQHRYERIGTYFATHLPDITAEFKYHNDGILIHENTPGGPSKKTYSLIEMEWIEGATLIDHVAQLCQSRDQSGLAHLLDQWTTVVRSLRRAKTAHCDLAGGNVMVRSDGRLVLVDYDGIYIPDFLGLPGIVEGQADYQHPEMSQRPFNEEADNFSAMVIYTALLALSVQPDLWGKYTSQQTANKTTDTNLLFKRRDFVDPDHSPLFAELEQLPHAQLSTVLADLKQACQLPVTQVQLSSLVSDPELEHKKALTRLEQAIRQNNDEEIVNSWIPALLDTYAPAQQHRARYQHAQNILQKLNTFRSALQSGLLQRIVTSYDAELDPVNSVTARERDLLRLAQRFQAALTHDRDGPLLAIWDELFTLNYASAFVFTRQETQRLALAQQRDRALQHFQRVANAGAKGATDIIAAYDAVLDSCLDVTPEQRNLLQAAHAFLQMQTEVHKGIQNDSDLEIYSAYDQTLAQQFADFSPLQQTRISRALKRGQWETALQDNEYAQAIRLAQEIEQEAHAPINDFRMLTAKQKFIRQFNVKDAVAWRSSDDVFVQWSWPAESLVRHAVIVWRFDRWPQNPRREEVGTGQERVFRHNQEQRCFTSFKAAAYKAVYLQVYFALPDYSQQPPAWFYTDGHEPGSKATAYYSGPDSKVI